MAKEYFLVRRGIIKLIAYQKLRITAIRFMSMLVEDLQDVGYSRYEGIDIGATIDP